MSKELEALLQLKEYNKLDNIWFDMTKELEIIEPALKSLEIIKEKEPSFIRLRLTRNSEHYNLIMTRGRELTQEEYDLLKEVLEDD